jgi:calcineurin-like phosphoesterase family protein
MAAKGSIPEREVRISPTSIKLMTDTIIDNTNAVLFPGDRLWIIGDVFFAPKAQRAAMARQFRSRIKAGVTVNVIMGNHDDDVIKTDFADNVYDQILITVEGQKLFLNHYPMRSWDGAHYGAWMLYGHVHNLFRHEDNGKVSPYYEDYYYNNFRDVIDQFPEFAAIQDGVKDKLSKKLIDVVASTHGIDLTVDVGVDNQIRMLPFGTPWSIEDLRTHFKSRIPKWEKRHAAFRSF